MISASSFASNLIDNSFAVSKDSPGALHNKLGALAFSASSREPPSAGSGLESLGNSMPRSTATFSWTAPGNRQERAHCSLDNDRRLQGNHREWARKDPKQQLRRRRSPHAPVPIPLNFAMRAAESPDRAARKPRPPCSLPSLRRHQAECAQNLWTCKPRCPLEGQRTLPNSHMRHKQVRELNSGSPSCGTSMLPTFPWALPDTREHRGALPPETQRAT